jgi:hypothetical protein
MGQAITRAKGTYNYLTNSGVRGIKKKERQCYNKEMCASQLPKGQTMRWGEYVSTRGGVRGLQFGRKHGLGKKKQILGVRACSPYVGLCVNGVCTCIPRTGRVKKNSTP